MTIAQGEVHDAAYEFKVLVADDSRVYRKLIEHSLSDKGYALLFAESGHEALALFAEHEPSIVITDWMMPDRTLRAHPQTVASTVHLRHHPHGKHGEG
jgi:CheY-like chemotaxis protein